MRTMRLGAIAAGLLIGTVMVALAAERVVTLWQAPEAARLAGASADIRLLLAGAVVAWSLAIAVALLHLVSRQDRIAEQEMRLGRMLSEQEVHLAARCRELSAQLMHSREVVMNDMVSLDTAQQHRQGLQEMRFASLEASLKRIDDTLTERMEGMAALVSHHLQASSSRQGGSDATATAPALDAHLQRIDRHLSQRLDEMESRLTQPGSLGGNGSGFIDFDPFTPVVATQAAGSGAPDDRLLRDVAERIGLVDGRLEQLAAGTRHDIAELGAMLVRLDRRMDHPANATGASDVAPAVDAALKRAIDALGRRLDCIEIWLRQHGEHVGTAFTDLTQRLEERPVNNSVFGELSGNSLPMPLDAGASTAASGATASGLHELQSMMLNLAHLQVDLRTERSQLRRRLRDLGGEAPAAAAGG
jgi:hypothetical protein